MNKEKIINNKRCRFYDGLWFADTGDFVARYEKDRGCYESCTIYPTVNLGACVEEMFYEETLDEVVAKLFGPPYPHDGKTYWLIHKDGNEMNCDYRNLEWVGGGPFQRYKTTTAPKVFLRYYHWIYEIYSTGVIKHGDEVLKQYDFDPERYKYTTILGDFEIHIDAGYYVVPVDEFMARARYVQGDIYGLKSPKILHRDGDYKNFYSENLEWVEETDPRFISYMEKKGQTQQARIKELIAQNLLPPDWEPWSTPVPKNDKNPTAQPNEPFVAPSFCGDNGYGKDPESDLPF